MTEKPSWWLSVQVYTNASTSGSAAKIHESLNPKAESHSRKYAEVTGLPNYLYAPDITIQNHDSCSFTSEQKNCY